MLKSECWTSDSVVAGGLASHYAHSFDVHYVDLECCPLASHRSYGLGLATGGIVITVVVPDGVTVCGATLLSAAAPLNGSFHGTHIDVCLGM